MNASAPIQKLFANYEAAFDKLDLEKQAELFADSFIMAGPHGAVSQSKTEFLQKASTAVAYYKSVGHTGAKIFSIDEEPVSREYVKVKAHWGVSFEKLGDKLVEFDISYVIFTGDNTPKIILAITHEDEQEAMKKLGVLKG